MSSETHHLSIQITLGCGCEHEIRIPGDSVVTYAESFAANSGVSLPLDWHFPSPAANFQGLLMVLNSPILDLITSDGHLGNGNENMTFKVNTKLGPCPDTIEEFEKRLKGDDYEGGE